MAKILNTREADFFFYEIQQFLELALIINKDVTLYWFLIQTFYSVLKEAEAKSLY